MRIAILFKDSLKDRKGLLNAVLSRANALIALDSSNQVDLYCIHLYYNRLSCFLNNISYDEQFEEEATLDGLLIHWLWVKVSLGDVIRQKLLHASQHSVERRCVEQAVKHFDSYDIISAHSLIAGIAANAIAKRQRKHFYVTWHGTDIHTAPFLNKEIFKSTHSILCSAKKNFFVSKALHNQAKAICTHFEGEILYNGVSEKFCKFDYERRKHLKVSYHIHDEKVVAFCGNVIDVKNVDVLPTLFERIEKLYKGSLLFWVIGDGNKRKSLQGKMQKQNIKFWGNVPAGDMPDLINCIDVLVLPSKNEGLPLVTIEAIACGANVVGSKVGGIPEVVGEENCFDLDENFIENMSSRTVEMLEGKITQNINDVFDWSKTARIELSIYCLDNH